MGDIPSFSALNNLTFLELGDNQLTGEIPDFNQSGLVVLALYSNNLSGNITDLSQLSNLQTLSVYNNNLSGCYPPFICNLSGFSSFNNPLLPWQGDFSHFCNSEPQVGAPCDDGDAGTSGEVILSDCSCGVPCPSFSASINGPTAICLGEQATLTFSFAASSGNLAPPFNVTWTNGTLNGIMNGHTEVVSPTAPTIYSITSVTDANGCTGVPGSSANVTVAPLPTPTASSNSPICEGQTLTLGEQSGSGNQWLWSGPNGFSSNSQNPTIPSSAPANSGNYVVTVTNALGCTGTSSVNVTVNPLPNILVGSNAPLCEGSILALSESGGDAMQWSWSGPNGFSSNFQNPTIPTVTTTNAGTYSVTITDNNGCTRSTNLVVTINVNPLISSTSNSPVCEGGALSLSGVGPNGNWSWSGPNAFTSNSQNPTIPSASPINSGVYLAIFTNAFGCADTSSTTALVHPLPNIQLGSNSPLCEGADLTLTETGGNAVQWSWSGPNGFTSNLPDPTIPTVNLSDAGTYSVTITDGNNCTRSASTSVTVNANPIMLPSSNSPICEGQSLSFVGVGTNGNWSWLGPNGFTSNLQNPSIPNAPISASGDYSITLTASNGCTGTAVINATVNEGTYITGLVPTSVNCAGGADGAIDLTAIGGAMPYSFDWNPPYLNGIEDPSGLFAGNYTATVTNANGCSDSATTQVTEPGFLVFSCGQTSPVSNSGGNDGVGFVVILGGTSPYGYAWSANGGSSGNTTANAPGTFSINNLQEGIYFVTLSDASGCTEICSFTIAGPGCTPFTANISGSATICPGAPTDLSFGFVNGMAPYTLTWTNGTLTNVVNGQTVTVSPSASTTYSIISAEDAYGCPANIGTSATVTVGDNTPPTIAGCPPPITATADPTQCTATVSWTPPTFMDNCPGGSLTSTHQPGDIFPLGVSTVVYTATDVAGNSSTCQISVNINDPTGACTPSTNCPAPGSTSISVTNLNDDGPGSLRQAISCVNADPILDTIKFNIDPNAFGPGPWTILLGSNLTPISNDSVVVDATTQPGWLAGMVRIVGTSTTDYGLSIDGDHCEVYGLRIDSVGVGIRIHSGAGSIIGANNKPNLILNCQTGIDLNVDSNIINGNFIGTTSNESEFGGFAAYAITVGTNNNRIENNTISGAFQSAITTGGTTNNLISKNRIYCNGLNPNGNGRVIFRGQPATHSILSASPAELSGIAGTGDIVEVFLSDNTSPCGAAPCQGKIYLGTAIADANGNWVLSAPFTVPLNNGDQVVSTATTMGNTSEYSVCKLVTQAPPSNDDCNGIVDLGIAPICPSGIFSNLFANTSNIGIDNDPGCFSTPAHDVWFSFVASPSINQYRITVEGVGVNPIDEPQVALYRGDCVLDGMILLDCSGSANSNEVVLETMGLTPGVQYFLRINATSANWGQFQICIEANPCTVTDLGIAATIANISCPGNADGAILINPSNGAAPFEYSINGGNFQPSNNFNNLSAGAYSIIVRDNFNCADSILNLSIQTPPNLTPNYAITPACEGSNGSFAQLTVSGGTSATGSYAFTWSDGSEQIGPSASFFNLAPGPYPFTVTDDNNCEQTATIEIAELPPSEYFLDTILCGEQTLSVAGSSFNAAVPSGQVVLSSAAFNGCDSIINVNLTFFPAATLNLTQTLCIGGSIMVNGTMYDQTNPTGTETLPNASFLGCDSTIFINLSFGNTVTYDLTQTLCPGESVTVNGNVYDQTNSSGIENLPNASYLGCDSTINVSLNFFQPSSSDLALVLCPGESVTVNGNVYDQANPTGTETLPNASYLGCDSIVNVSLNFFQPSSSDFAPTLCPGESVTVNGNMYDQANPTGTETLPNANYLGCDSTVNVSLSFFQPSSSDFAPTLCPGGSVTVNGNVYDQANPTGTEILPNASYFGCDSTVNISLSFFQPSSSDFTPTLCPGGSVTVNGNVYDQANPMGTEILPNVSYFGCDSTVNISLSFFQPSSSDLVLALCPGESVTINGTVYDQANPTGTEILPNASYFGCDSTLNVQLVFLEALEYTIDSTICEGDTVLFNGQALGSSGEYQATIASSGGCDSIIAHLILTIIAPPTPTAKDDEAKLVAGETSIDINIVDNDELNGEGWTTDLLLTSPNGSIVPLGNDGFAFNLTNPDAFGLDSFTYEICHDLCPLRCDTATVFLSIEPDCFPQSPQELSNVFTPNNDGVNDVFDPLETYRKSGCMGLEEMAEISIVNRWGEVIFRAKPYKAWNGGFNDNPSSIAQQGSYYYYLKITTREKQLELKGAVNLLAK